MKYRNYRVLTEADLDGCQTALPEWKRAGDSLEYSHDFSSFRLAIEFVVRVAEIAEEFDHHPDIDIRYRKVCIRLTTHSAGGLTSRDVEMAGRIGTLLPESGKR